MNIQQNIPLAPFTTFHIGGIADYFIITPTLYELIGAVRFAKDEGLPYFILGTGANILIGDKGFRGLVIKNEAKKVIFHDTNNKKTGLLTAESGVTMEELIRQTSEKGLSGFEHFTGIPSSLGGAMWQNLHFYSPDRTRTIFIGEVVKKATILDHNDRIRKVDVSYFNYDYDSSILHKFKDVVLDVTFELSAASKKQIQDTMIANLSWRDQKHPEDAINRSAGSIFKNIPGHGAGRLIDRVGLKGKSIGGAEISERHANFIINKNNATASDVRNLISLVQTSVKQEFGLDLQTEISFIGEF